ncbi:MAG: hypothetical protein GEU95_18955 [Rhizobiales bacterium]|nr:hypothetical protein [Hyphomicrobiales bacterium]
MFGWAAAVYFLCFLASAGCSWLLVRSYVNSRTKLLLWSAICFILLALNNFFLFIDLALLPTMIDLSLLRLAIGLSAVSALLYGFIWELD